MRSKINVSGDAITTLTVVVIIAILIVAASSIVIVLFLPIKPVDVYEHREIASEAGVDSIDLEIEAEIAQVDVTFDDLGDKFMTLDVWVRGGIGILQDEPDYNITFDYDIVDDTLEVDVNVDQPGIFESISFLNVDCELVISDTLRTDLGVSIDIGSITMRTIGYSNITGLDLDASTGSIMALIVPGTTVWGNVSLGTSTGSVDLEWEDVIIQQDTDLSLISSTGEVNVDVSQERETGFDLSISGVTNTGSVSADVIISGNISSSIDWEYDVGSVDIHRQVGFTQTDGHMESENHPGTENIAIALSTSTGSVDIWAEWTS
jgi:hypothetical protein